MDVADIGRHAARGWPVGVNLDGILRRGITSHQFDLSPPSAEIRTFEDCYRLVGQECDADPTGSRQTRSVPNSVGKVAIIATEWGEQYIQHSHIPLVTVESIQGLSIAWPACISTGEQPVPAEKVVILGGHIGLSGEEIAMGQCVWMVPRLYPGGVIRQVMRDAQNHFESNLPSASTRGRAVGLPPVANTPAYSPTTMRQAYGQDRLSAVLSGVAPGARTRYLTAWHRWEQFMLGRRKTPLYLAHEPDWGDSLTDYIMFESKILANAPNALSGKISGIRFWRLLVGVPDFTVGGGPVYPGPEEHSPG